MTALPFPLDTLTSSTTRDAGIDTLDRRDCVLIYRDEEAMQTTFPACDVQAYISTSEPLDAVQQDIINHADNSQCNAKNCIVIVKP
jgi:triacylglycerol esterase/lipase EstA (alpha/beta hydrolase family)